MDSRPAIPRAGTMAQTHLIGEHQLLWKRAKRVRLATRRAESGHFWPSAKIRQAI